MPIKRRPVEGTIYHVDGTRSVKTFNTFTEVQQTVGGYVTRFYIGEDAYYHDDDGLLINKPLNPNFVDEDNKPAVAGVVVKLHEDVDILPFG